MCRRGMWPSLELLSVWSVKLAIICVKWVKKNVWFRQLFTSIRGELSILYIWMVSILKEGGKCPPASSLSEALNEVKIPVQELALEVKGEQAYIFLKGAYFLTQYRLLMRCIVCCRNTTTSFSTRYRHSTANTTKATSSSSRWDVALKLQVHHKQCPQFVHLQLKEYVIRCWDFSPQCCLSVAHYFTWLPLLYSVWMLFCCTGRFHTSKRIERIYMWLGSLKGGGVPPLGPM